MRAAAPSADQRGPCPPRRPRLAYVSPLPPERSGIADYSAELLPELARYYEIEVVLAQDRVSDPWSPRQLPACAAPPGFATRRALRPGALPLWQFRLPPAYVRPAGTTSRAWWCCTISFFPESRAHGSDRRRPGYWARALYESHGYAAASGTLSMATRPTWCRPIPATCPCSSAPAEVIVHCGKFAQARAALVWRRSGTALARDSRTCGWRSLQPARRGARAALGLDEHDSWCAVSACSARAN